MSKARTPNCSPGAAALTARCVCVLCAHCSRCVCVCAHCSRCVCVCVVSCSRCVCVSTAPGCMVHCSGVCEFVCHCSTCVCVSTAPGVCALGWIKCISPFHCWVILCITVYVTNKHSSSSNCWVFIPVLYSSTSADL